MPFNYGTNEILNAIYKKSGTPYDISSVVFRDIDVMHKDYFTFTLLEDDTYSVSAADVTNMPTDLIIPSEYDGKAVTTIPDYAFVDLETGYGCGSVKKLTIPSSIKSIGVYAFAGATSLIKVTFSDGLLTIGDWAFSNANKLEYVILPDSLTAIGRDAFSSCSSLKAVYIPESVATVGTNVFNGGLTSDGYIYCGADSQPSGWNDYWNSNSNSSNVVWGYKLTDESLFTFTEQTDGTYSVKATDVTNLPNEVGIPFSYNGKAVTAIDENAFDSATINKVVIPEGVTRIGNGAFDNCKRLLNVSLPNTLAEIGGWAFRDCTALTSIVIPIGVTTIGTWAFLRDMSLTINCEAASQPSGWDADWNISGGTVVWGYTG